MATMTDDQIVDMTVAAAARLAAIAAQAEIDPLQREPTLAAVDALVAAAPKSVSAPAAFLAAYAAACRALAKHGAPDALYGAIGEEAVQASTSTAIGAGMAAIVVGLYATLSVRRGYAARQDASAARSALAAASEPIVEPVGDRLGAASYAALSAMTGQAAIELSRVAADRAPLVRVETGVSLPSTVIAWRLYGDARRAGELVERNRAGTPIFMPAAIEAIAE